MKNTSNDPRTRAQQLKDHYQSHFIKYNEEKTSNIFCNYFCKLEYISVECHLRKESKKSKVA
jgi:lipopolysaccharide biosynthesis protein